ncbi:NDP-hexose 2,3-dehydratase family protein [Streptomyces sp. NPDC001530]|uniref:NDP-hexose 2,3-dehydratase family protein n=1 Tax=Streptomyces sp. NPDC001530 TaxID=3364582 RepID=UPI0036AA6F35
MTGTVMDRIARSAATVDTSVSSLDDFHRWFKTLAAAVEESTRVRPIPFDEMRGWHTQAETGNLQHDSGRFFTVEGLEVHAPDSPTAHWSQPILCQPETGILGLVAKEFDGVLHFLMQAKMEPGNINGLQLSPTVQATRSNFTRVHRGASVPYVEFFQDMGRHRVMVDVRQSEQGSWFYRKSNRNVVVEVSGDFEVLDGFRWLTLGQLHRLLSVDDLVNMDSRTVMGCLPYPFSAPRGDGAVLPGIETLSWITEMRSSRSLVTGRVPLRYIGGWHRGDDLIFHESGSFFSVMAVDVRAGTREVASWTQPMIQPHGTGVAAFLIRRHAEEYQALVSTRTEPGSTDILELAPTVQANPRNYAHLPQEARPPHLDAVLEAPAGRILFDTVLSEEGGRFHHARNRYLIVDTDPEHEPRVAPGQRWIGLAELSALLRHSHYVNVEARTLMACLQGVVGAEFR